MEVPALICDFKHPTIIIMISSIGINDNCWKLNTEKHISRTAKVRFGLNSRCQHLFKSITPSLLAFERSKAMAKLCSSASSFNVRGKPLKLWLISLFSCLMLMFSQQNHQFQTLQIHHWRSCRWQRIRILRPRGRNRPTFDATPDVGEIKPRGSSRECSMERREQGDV